MQPARTWLQAQLEQAGRIWVALALERHDLRSPRRTTTDHSAQRLRGNSGLLFTSLIIAGVAIGAYVLRPRRIELVHTEARDGWTARITKSGRWSAEDGWLGRTRYDLEIVGEDNTIYSYRPLIFERDDALEFMNAELDGLGARQL